MVIDVEFLLNYARFMIDLAKISDHIETNIDIKPLLRITLEYNVVTGDRLEILLDGELPILKRYENNQVEEEEHFDDPDNSKVFFLRAMAMAMRMVNY